jgi:hypothetical protein
VKFDTVRFDGCRPSGKKQAGETRKMIEEHVKSPNIPSAYLLVAAMSEIGPVNPPSSP